MNRRDFLRLGAERTRVLEVSCETLYMNYLDSQMNGTTDRFLERIRRDLRKAGAVRLREAFWLDREDLKQALEPVLSELRTRGTRVEYR